MLTGCAKQMAVRNMTLPYMLTLALEHFLISKTVHMDWSNAKLHQNLAEYKKLKKSTTKLPKTCPRWAITQTIFNQVSAELFYKILLLKELIMTDLQK